MTLVTILGGGDNNSGKAGTTDTDKRENDGEGFDTDKLGKYISQENYQALLDVRPDFPENCGNCFELLEEFQKVYVKMKDRNGNELEKKDWEIYCPECMTMDKVASVL